MLELMLTPRRAFARLAERSDGARLGVLCVVAMSACWAVLLAVLAVGGHAPSGPPVLPIPAERYYAWEAAFVLPVRLGMLGALAAVIHVGGRRLGGAGSLGQATMVAGVSMALPSVLLWAAPDALVLAVWGFEHLGSAMRYYVPLCALWTVALTTAGARAIHGLSVGRALVVAVAGLLAHGVVGAPFLR